MDDGEPSFWILYKKVARLCAPKIKSANFNPIVFHHVISLSATTSGIALLFEFSSSNAFWDKQMSYDPTISVVVYPRTLAMTSSTREISNWQIDRFVMVKVMLSH